MPTLKHSSAALVSLAPDRPPGDPGQQAQAGPERGFGSGSGDNRGGKGGSRKKGSSRGGRKRSPGLSPSDRLPLGKHPDLEAVLARRTLGLPLSGRLTAQEVTKAYRLAAADHHPDRGGRHGLMQAVNAARDELLGRRVNEE